jgi:gamma-glutamyltranspeptidase/glutathione hydrolase
MTRYRFATNRLIVAIAAIVCTAVHAASVAPVGGEHGMVVTAHQLATKVGVDVLKRGGNAVDCSGRRGLRDGRRLPCRG